VDKLGRVSVENVTKAIQAETKLVSIMFASNEIGTIQPISEIAKELQKRNILFHTDAVQAVGHVPIDVKKIGVDFLSASAHKFNGPKGIGFLYVKQNLELPPLIYGGGQERGLRGGTENVASIVGMATALEESVQMLASETTRIQKLTSKLVERIKGNLANVLPSLSVIVNGDSNNKLYSIVSLTFSGGVLGESIVHGLGLKDICLSTASACHAGSNLPSHVLRAIGLTDEQALSTIRISLGRYNTTAEVETIADNLVRLLAKTATA